MGTPKGTVPHNAGKGKGWTDSRGYRVKSETINGRRKQVREHRTIMEAHLGRKLEPWEVVHHKDGDTLNNALANLEVMDIAEHTAEHAQGSRKSYDTRRTMEAIATMRTALIKERAVNAELLAALEQILVASNDICAADHENRNPYYGAGDISEIARAAIAKAKS